MPSIAAPPPTRACARCFSIFDRCSGQNYLPYSVALLQTYVQKMADDPGRYRFLPSLYKRVRIADAVEALKDADLVIEAVFEDRDVKKAVIEKVEAVLPEDRAPLLGALQRARSGESVTVEYRIHRPNGELLCSTASTA